MYSKDFEDPDQFFHAEDQMPFNASQILLLVIGEEVRKISQELKDEHPIIPWKEVSNVRNRIAHDYRGIDPNIPFDIIKNYLPELKVELKKMLTKVEFDKQVLIKAVNSYQYRHLRYLLNDLL